MNDVTHVDHVLIHYEPVRKETISFAVPLENIQGKISEHFGEAPHFALITVKAEDRTVKSREIVYNPFLSVERGKGIMVAEFLIERDVDILLLRRRFEGKGPEYVLSNSDVEVSITDAETMNDALSHQGVALEGGVYADNYTG